MPSDNEQEQIRQITIRWPDSFWETVTIAATKRRTSVQALVTESVAAELGIAAPGAAEAA